MVCCGPLPLIKINKEKHGDDSHNEHDHDDRWLGEVEGDIKEDNDK